MDRYKVSFLVLRVKMEIQVGIVIEGIGAVSAVELNAVATVQQIPPEVQVAGSQACRGTIF